MCFKQQQKSNRADFFEVLLSPRRQLFGLLSHIPMSQISKQGNSKRRATTLQSRDQSRKQKEVILGQPVQEATLPLQPWQRRWYSEHP